MKEFRVLKGHKKEVCCTSQSVLASFSEVLSLTFVSIAVTWHPFHPLLVSGGSEGSILHWDLSSSTSPLPTQSTNHAPGPRATLSQAHDSNVWSLAFHPLGHILVSASNDQTTRFWCRERPGDATSVFSGGGEKPPDDVGEVGGTAQGEDEEDQFIVPGFVGYNGNWGGEDQPQQLQGSVSGSGINGGGGGGYDSFGRNRGGNIHPPTGPSGSSSSTNHIPNDSQDDFIPGLGLPSENSNAFGFPTSASGSNAHSMGGGASGPGSSYVAGRRNGPLPSQEDLYGHEEEHGGGGSSASGGGNYGGGSRGGSRPGGGRRWGPRRRH